MKLLYSLLFVSTLASGWQFAAASGGRDDNEVRVVTFPIPLMIESEQQGLFIELTRRIAELESLPLTITMINTPRALVKFAADEFDVMVPGVEGMFSNDNGVLLGTETIYLKRDIVFSHTQSPIYRSIADLRGARVGLTRGYPYAPALLSNSAINTVFVKTDEQNARLLMAGRIDAFVAERHSGIQAFKNINHLADVHFESKQWISELKVVFAFRDNAHGQMLEARFANAIKNLKQSGGLQAILAHPDRDVSDD